MALILSDFHEVQQVSEPSNLTMIDLIEFCADCCRCRSNFCFRFIPSAVEYVSHYVLAFKYAKLYFIVHIILRRTTSQFERSEEPVRSLEGWLSCQGNLPHQRKIKLQEHLAGFSSCSLSIGISLSLCPHQTFLRTRVLASDWLENQLNQLPLERRNM